MQIRFPVGDWSDDGHGKCSYFLVESNKTLAEVGATHISCKEKLGFDIGDICRDYEDSELGQDIFDKLVAAGFDILNADQNYFGGSIDNGRYMNVETVFSLWIDILMFLDPNLQLMPVNEVPALNNWSVSGVNTPGYGCFY